MSKFLNKLKEYRRGKSLTVTELSEKVKVSRDTIQDIEDGHMVPSTELAKKISKSLDSEIDEIFLS